MSARIALSTTVLTLAVVAAASAGPARELPQSPSWQQGRFAALAPAVTYRASLVEPAPTVRATKTGWRGTQIVTHQSGQVRYESAVFLGHQGEIDLVTGPAMTLPPAAVIDAQLRHVQYWQFGPGEAPSPVQRWLVAGRRALYFEATDPGPSAWTLVGTNPAELQIQRGESFRMTTLAVRGRTVVVVIRTQKASFAGFLPAARRLLAGLAFPVS